MTRRKEFLVHFHDVISSLSVAHYERKVKWNKDIHFNTDEGKKFAITKSNVSLMARKVEYAISPGSKVRSVSMIISGNVR